MGYTHRLVVRGCEVSSWESIVRDFRKVVSAYERMGFKLRSPDGHGEPIINDREIRFNGDARCGHREFEFSFLPVKEKKVTLPDGSVYVWTTGYYCDGDCSHESHSAPSPTFTITRSMGTFITFVFSFKDLRLTFSG